jgi:hypothetical protein
MIGHLGVNLVLVYTLVVFGWVVSSKQNFCDL